MLARARTSLGSAERGSSKYQLVLAWAALTGGLKHQAFTSHSSKLGNTHTSTSLKDTWT